MNGGFVVRKGLLVVIVLVSASFILGDTRGGSVRPLEFGALSSTTVDDFDELLKQAVELTNQRKFEEGLAKCAAAAALRPLDHRPHYVAGQNYYFQWKMRSASEAFAKAIALSPSNKGIFLYKSKADRRRNAKDEAVAAAREAIKLDVKFAEAYFALADALSIGATDYSEIIEAYRTAIKLKPGLLDAYEQLGMFLKITKDVKGAEEVYRKAMMLDPKGMSSRFSLGRLLVDQGRLSEARELWNGRSSDVDRTFPNFITLLERAERKKAAEENLAKTPNDPKALLEFGLVLMEGESWRVDGRQEKALDYFKRALEIDPKLTAAQMAICKAFVELADLDKSKNQDLDRELAKLRALDPESADQIEAYRKKYKGALQAVPIDNQ